MALLLVDTHKAFHGWLYQTPSSAVCTPYSIPVPWRAQVTGLAMVLYFSVLLIIRALPSHPPALDVVRTAIHQSPSQSRAVRMHLKRSSRPHL